MTDPKRLHEMEIDRRTRLLIEAGLDDAPPRRRLERIATGIASGAVVLGTKVAAAEVAGGATAARLVSSVLITKWLTVGAFGGLAVSLGLAELGEVTKRGTEPSGAAAALVVVPDRQQLAVTREPSLAEQALAVTPEARTSISGSRLDEPSALPSRPVAVTGASTPLPAAAAEPSALPSKPVPIGGASGSFPAAGISEPSVLREEIAMIARAKAALDRNAPAEALATARSYRARFPSGRLEPEASAIELEANLALGNRTDATALARRLATGSGPSAVRARQVLQGGLR